MTMFPAVNVECRTAHLISCDSNVLIPIAVQQNVQQTVIVDKATYLQFLYSLSIKSFG